LVLGKKKDGVFGFHPNPQRKGKRGAKKTHETTWVVPRQRKKKKQGPAVRKPDNPLEKLEGAGQTEATSRINPYNE